MISLPVPLFTAAVLAYLAVRAVLLADTSRMVVALVALCAVQSAVIALNQHYGLTYLAPVQPVAAAAIAVFAYLTFLANSVRPLQAVPDGLHLLPPLAVALCFFAAPQYLDTLLVMSFAGYGTAILVQLRRGSDSLALVRLEGSERAVYLWRCVAGALLLSALGDILIGTAILLGPDTVRPVLVSAYSVVFLLVIALISLSETVARPAPSEHERGPASSNSKTAGPQHDDPELLEKLETHMRSSEAYLDPDLTLRKLARQLTIPEKHLSASINQATGENLPRYINRFRIGHACKLMVEGSSVTAAIYASGFNTKSNFNREFLRLKGVSPSAWLANHKPP
ncbi:AraC family transcriptional regulator [Roseibium denhamense]|uniref:Transcriptional regulator, AraC family n=1 Tax=Roseibium denhamense TaxID=76305 RepID=A0ABY1NTZ9_9HYPH|nr:AraC family transcriptional regulator [Roseibium denhamense]MTI05342.1 AraC family transcriptional regulator [Roseibium denhamense]SMP17233.1 transcriptional regulator, AraC family [Roseibium denhamense]